MSFGYCPFTTVAALKAADKILGPDRVWTGNARQRDWLMRFYESIVPTLPDIPEIAANATSDAQEHAAFLQKHGWEAQLKSVGRGEFLAAGVMDLLVHWKAEGEKAPITTPDRKQYPGVFLERNVTFWETLYGTAACLATKTNDRVWLVMPYETDAVAVQMEARHLTYLAQSFLIEPKQKARHEGLYFPMVDLALKQPLDWMKGIATEDRNGSLWQVSEAVQQMTLKMNHKGARARAADELRIVEMGATLVDPPLIINRPFLAIFERPSVFQPIFTAYVTEGDWKDPGEL